MFIQLKTKEAFQKKASSYQYFIFLMIGVITFLLLPFLYGFKMESGMEKTDLYFFWAIGTLAWLGFLPHTLERTDLLLGAIIVLATITTSFQVYGDVNSYKILITIFFSFGIYCSIRSQPLVSDSISWIFIPSLLCQLSFGYWQFIRFNADPLMMKGLLFNSGYLRTGLRLALYCYCLV